MEHWCLLQNGSVHPRMGTTHNTGGSRRQKTPWLTISDKSVLRLAEARFFLNDLKVILVSFPPSQKHWSSFYEPWAHTHTHGKGIALDALIQSFGPVLPTDMYLVYTVSKVALFEPF